ncbi:hypothetical protein AAY78_00110 [Microbacterium sp. Ag1]|nr:hypothetical protein AAY78_00110 [Microbacterium sp. Ag1]
MSADDDEYWTIDQALSRTIESTAESLGVTLRSRKTADTATSTFEFVFTADEEGRRISLALIPVVLRHRS